MSDTPPCCSPETHSFSWKRFRLVAAAGSAGRFRRRSWASAGDLMADRRGAAAVEFAIVGGALLLTIVFIMMLGLMLYFSQVLDHATDLAARQVMTGVVQKANLTQTAFQTTVVCASLPAAMNCNDVIVNLQTVPEAAGPAGYYTFVNANQTALNVPTLSSSSGQYAPGTQGSYVYLQVIYPITFLPSFMASLFGAAATYNGKPAYLVMSTAAFRNEQY